MNTPKITKERKCAFTIVSDDYYVPVGTPKFINSFKRFHPEIPLIVFRQDVIDFVFKQRGLNFFNAKPTMAKLLVNDYDLICNIDADSVVLSRLDEVFDKDDFEVGGVINYNDYENRSVENVTEKMFLNAGLVASRKKEFWDIWEEANRNAYKYVCAENDILCLIWYNNTAYKKKIFDLKKNYLGCKSLGREREFYMEDGKVMCRGEQVKIYHHAKGPGALPKLQFEKMGFPRDVVDYMNWVSNFGKSEIYGNI